VVFDQFYAVADTWLHHIAIGPLSPAETRKLQLRLTALAASDVGKKDAVKDVRDDIVLRLIGGHPRMLELVDALLRGGQGRMPVVTEKLRQLAEHHEVDLATPVSDITDAMQTALLLGARDVLLDDCSASCALRASKKFCCRRQYRTCR